MPVHLVTENGERLVETTTNIHGAAVVTVVHSADQPLRLVIPFLQFSQPLRVEAVQDVRVRTEPQGDTP